MRSGSDRLSNETGEGGGVTPPRDAYGIDAVDAEIALDCRRPEALFQLGPYLSLPVSPTDRLGHDWNCGERVEKAELEVGKRR
jgi:hypothetical protein